MASRDELRKLREKGLVLSAKLTIMVGEVQLDFERYEGDLTITVLAPGEPEECFTIDYNAWKDAWWELERIADQCLREE